MSLTRGLVLDVARQVGGAMPGVVTLLDHSRFGNHGAMTNVTWTQLPSGLWVKDYNGTNSVTTIADADNLSFPVGGMTISLWVNRDNNNAQDPLVSKYSGIAATSEYILSFENTNRIYFWVYDSVASALVGRFAPDFDGGNWRMLTVTYNGGIVAASCRIYIDGVQSDTGDFVAGVFASMHNTTEIVRIGRAVGGIISYADCQMALLYMRNYALSPGQILQRFEATRRLFGV